MSTYRILVVDDQRDVRRLLCTWLASLDAEIKITDVPSGEEAVLVLSRQKFDLLVADVRLAGMSGVELVHKVRQRNPEICVILVTGLTDPVTQHQMTDAKVDGIFYKPVIMEDFLYAVERLLGLEDTVYTLEAIPEVSPQAVAEDKDDPSDASISTRLAEVRRSLGATAAALLNERSEVIAQAGKIPDEIAAMTVLATLISSLNNSAKVSVLLGVDAPNNYMRISGAGFDLHLTQVGIGLALLVVTQADAGSADPGGLASQLRSFASQMQGALAEMTAPAAPQTIPAPVESVPEVEGEGIEGPDLADLEAVLGEAMQADLANQDVDQFWDSFSETTDVEGIASAGQITYEQARRLGLAPEEKGK